MVVINEKVWKPQHFTANSIQSELHQGCTNFPNI